jgi:hypothetical protein
MNDWTHGYPLEQLKTYAGIFKDAHKPLVFGAFGLVKERDIAQALVDDNLLQIGDPPQALAIVSCSKRPSKREDFAKREYIVAAESLQIKALAGNSAEAVNDIMVLCLERAKGSPIWAEIFEEDPFARQAMVDFTYVTTKISAGGEVKGIYLYGSKSPLPPLSAAESAALEILELQFLKKEKLAAICNECQRFDKYWTQHYSTYNKRKSWTSFALRGYSDDPSFIIKPSEMSKSWKEENAAVLQQSTRWTAATEYFPVTMEAVERLGKGSELDRVRFMRLRAKDGELSRHADITDHEAGVANGCIARLHVPIRTSNAVSFYGWDTRGRKIEKKLPEGSLCYLDQRKPHAVKNTDLLLDRIHLVIDLVSNERLRKTIGDVFTKSNQ